MSLSPTITAKDLFLKACKEGNVELARILLANGAGVNWGGDLDWSALHLAAVRCCGDLLDLLLAQPGVEVNIKNKSNKTPLMFAREEAASS